jgi:hypothetical protein
MPHYGGRETHTAGSITMPCFTIQQTRYRRGRGVTGADHDHVVFWQPLLLWGRSVTDPGTSLSWPGRGKTVARRRRDEAGQPSTLHIVDLLGHLCPNWAYRGPDRAAAGAAGSYYAKEECHEGGIAVR